MSKRLSLTVLLWLPAMTVMAQEASEGHGGGAGWMAPIWHVPMIAWQIVNFLLVVGLFVYLLRRPAPQFFESRAREIQSLLEKALKEKEEALARLKEVEDKMARLGDEVASIEQASKESAEADKRRVLEEAEAARVRIREEARAEMERRVLEAKRELRAFAADMAVKMARELLVQNLTDEDERRLQVEFLGLLEEESREQHR